MKNDGLGRCLKKRLPGAALYAAAVGLFLLGGY